jgi:hypothetical protein
MPDKPDDSTPESETPAEQPDSQSEEAAVESVTGSAEPGKPSREDEYARLAPVRIETAMTLSREVMERVIQLDAHRRALVGNDAQLNEVLGAIELDTIRKAKAIQRQIFLGRFEF